MSTVLDLLQTAVDSNRQSSSPMTAAPGPGPGPANGATTTTTTSNGGGGGGPNSTLFSPTRQNFYTGSYFGQTSSYALRIANLPYDITNRELRLLFALSNDFVSCFISSMIINADGTRSGVVYFKSNQALRKSFSLLNNRADVFDGQQRPLVCEILSPKSSNDENVSDGSSNSSNGSVSPQNQPPSHSFRFFEEGATNGNGVASFNRGKNLLLESTDNDEIERIMNSRDFFDDDDDDVPLSPQAAPPAPPQQPPVATATTTTSSSSSTSPNAIAATTVNSGTNGAPSNAAPASAGGATSSAGAVSATISHIPAITTNDSQEIEKLINDGQGGRIVIPYSASTNSSTAVQVMQNGGRVLPPANPADQNPPCNTLYVGNIPPNTVEEELISLFSKQDGYRRLSFKVKNNGPMCFVEFSDVRLATKALSELYGYGLSNSVKGGLRLSFSKNPLGVRSERDKRKK